MSADSSEILFPEGIVGVPRARRFHLLEQPGSPIRLLKSLDIEDFRLPVVDPFLVDADYKPALGARVSEFLEVEEGDALLLLAIAVIRQGEAPAVNLRAPLVINASKSRGMQWILEDTKWSLQAPATSLTSNAAAAPSAARDRRSHARTEP